jgi:hypothetical protein
MQATRQYEQSTILRRMVVRHYDVPSIPGQFARWSVHTSVQSFHHLHARLDKLTVGTPWSAQTLCSNGRRCYNPQSSCLIKAFLPFQVSCIDSYTLLVTNFMPPAHGVLQESSKEH